jgi:hypothetical protein
MNATDWCQIKAANHQNLACPARPEQANYALGIFVETTDPKAC